MNCLRPIIIKKKTDRGENKVLSDIDDRWQTEDIMVPCRKCPECQRKISLEWTRRILHEYENMGYYGYFVTLTYDEPYIPTDGVEKREIQLYLKRLRKLLHITNKNHSKIKYYACGEYGEKNGRPHYHLILIGVNKNDKDTIDKAWGFGITDIKTLNYATCKYVVDYLHKIIPEEIIAGRNKPFTLKSKGIGRDWFYKYQDEIIEDKCITTNGFKVSIPRYYLKKLKQNNKLLYDYLMEKEPDAIPRPDTFIEYLENEKIIQQHNANIKSLRDLK